MNVCRKCYSDIDEKYFICKYHSDDIFCDQCMLPVCEVCDEKHCKKCDDLIKDYGCPVSMPCPSQYNKCVDCNLHTVSNTNKYLCDSCGETNLCYDCIPHHDKDQCYQMKEIVARGCASDLIIYYESLSDIYNPTEEILEDMTNKLLIRHPSVKHGDIIQVRLISSRCSVFYIYDANQNSVLKLDYIDFRGEIIPESIRVGKDEFNPSYWLKYSKINTFYVKEDDVEIAYETLRYDESNVLRGEIELGGITFPFIVECSKTKPTVEQMKQSMWQYRQDSEKLDNAKRKSEKHSFDGEYLSVLV